MEQEQNLIYIDATRTVRFNGEENCVQRSLGTSIREYLVQDPDDFGRDDPFCNKDDSGETNWKRRTGLLVAAVAALGVYLLFKKTPEQHLEDYSNDFCVMADNSTDTCRNDFKHDYYKTCGVTELCDNPDYLSINGQCCPKRFFKEFNNVTHVGNVKNGARTVLKRVEPNDFFDLVVLDPKDKTFKRFLQDETIGPQTAELAKLNPTDITAVATDLYKNQSIDVDPDNVFIRICNENQCVYSQNIIRQDRRIIAAGTTDDQELVDILEKYPEAEVVNIPKKIKEIQEELYKNDKANDNLMKTGLVVVMDKAKEYGAAAAILAAKGLLYKARQLLNRR